MQYFDLHCDTLYKALSEKRTLDEPSYEVSVSRGKNFDKWKQCVAIWIPDGISDSDAMKLFLNAHALLHKESKRLNIDVCSNTYDSADQQLIFTVENGALIADSIDNVKLLSKCGVRMITLTWNAANCIGGGADTLHNGLTDFGKECVRELENNSIIIDISHASDKLFYEVIEHTTKPVVASHSNSRSVCPHRRNLTDDQFACIRERGGLVGLNFHRDFLLSEPKAASINDVLKHTEHFLSLGGEDVLCIGSDYDGSNIPNSLKGIEKIPDLYEGFLKIGYTEQLVQKIMYSNAHNFFSRF